MTRRSPLGSALAAARSARRTRSPARAAMPPRPIRVWIARAKTGPGDETVSRLCPADSGDPVSRFLTGSDAPVSVIATDLYQEIPPSADDRRARRDRPGPKATHVLRQPPGRRILRAVSGKHLPPRCRAASDRRRGRRRARDTKLGSRTWSAPIVREAERSLVLDPDDSRAKKRNAVATWLTRELVALDRRQSLEGTGVAEIRLVFPRRHNRPQPLISMGFSPEEADDLIRLLLDTLPLRRGDERARRGGHHATRRSRRATARSASGVRAPRPECSHGCRYEA